MSDNGNCKVCRIIFFLIIIFSIKMLILSILFVLKLFMSIIYFDGNITLAIIKILLIIIIAKFIVKFLSFVKNTNTVVNTLKTDNILQINYNNKKGGCGQC